MTPDLQDFSTAVPPHLQSGNFSETITARPEDEKPIFVVYVGNILLPVFRRNPFFHLGGKIYSETSTVPNHYLPRCAITRLEKSYLPVNVALVDKEQRKNYVKTFVKTNVYNPVTNRFEDVTVGGVPGVSSHLLFKEITPSRELGMILVGDGAVVVPGIVTSEDQKEAQNFYFENWGRIVRRLDSLPESLRALEDQILNRQAKTREAAMQAIGDAFINACGDYREWSRTYVKKQSDEIKNAEKVPGSYQSFSEEAALIFEYVGIARPDNMTENFSQNLANQAKTTDTLAQLMAQNAEQNRINAESNRLFQEYIMRQGVSGDENSSEEVPDPTIVSKSVAPTCGDGGGKDGTCGQTAGLDDNGRCRFHPLSAEDVKF